MVEEPVKSGFDGCVGWSGVFGSGAGVFVEALTCFVVAVESFSAERFKAIVTFDDA